MEDGDARVCSFCGKSQEQVRKLIAGPGLIRGPGVYMCDECITFGIEFLADAVHEPSPQGEPVACSFCGMTTHAGDVVASPAGVHICKQCVELGQEILDEEFSGPSEGS